MRISGVCLRNAHERRSKKNAFLANPVQGEVRIILKE